MKELTISGNSNSDVKILKNKNSYVIEKTDSINDNNCRLIHQIEKQNKFKNIVFSEKCINLMFYIPSILDTNVVENKYKVTMEYVHGSNVIDFFEKQSPENIVAIIEKLFFFIEWELDNSQKSLVKSKVIVNKVDELISKIEKSGLGHNPFFIKLLQDIKNKLIKKEYLELHTGICHGDLTFSNLIISNKIVLIDFLDTYLESPLQDITKLQQELNLHWTSIMSNIQKDRTKIKIGYQYAKKYFDSYLENIILKYNIDKEVLEIMYILTLIRILPYSDNEEVIETIYNELKKFEGKIK